MVEVGTAEQVVAAPLGGTPQLLAVVEEGGCRVFEWVDSGGYPVTDLYIDKTSHYLPHKMHYPQHQDVS